VHSYGLVITLSDVELTDEQSQRVRPALDQVFGSDATVAVWDSGGYHYWRVVYKLQAQSMLDAARDLIVMAEEVRDAAGLRPEQAVGYSVQFRDLLHPVELALPPEEGSSRAR
jgi:hypothetical protein